MTTNVSSESLAAPVLTRVQVALALALLLGLQPVTTDLYLPALPQLTRALGASMGAAQQTMAALLLVFGVGQLFWGPVADRVGRRPVLMLGLLLYTAAAVAGALAPSVQWLIGWRALQGLGLAAAVVCARALLRDLYEPHDGARVMAWGMSGLGLIAIASPTLGGAVAALAGWRAALALVACIGAAALAYVTWWVPETARRLRPDATRPAVLLSAWRRIATHPVFVGWALLTTCTYGGLFTILAGSSFVYIDVLGVSPALYGMLLGTGSAAYIAGTFICRRWVHRYGAVGAVQRGAWFTLAGGLAMVLPAALGLQSAHQGPGGHAGQQRPEAEAVGQRPHRAVQRIPQPGADAEGHAGQQEAGQRRRCPGLVRKGPDRGRLAARLMHAMTQRVQGRRHRDGPGRLQPARRT